MFLSASASAAPSGKISALNGGGTRGQTRAQAGPGTISASSNATIAAPITTVVLSRRPASPPHGVILAVRPHVDCSRDPVGHVEESRNRGDVPDVAIREADLPQPLAITLLDRPWLDRELDREIEHRALALVEVGSAIV